MTKHMIIAGVPRAGKSTVSQMIAKKLGYQHISMDSIIAGFEKVFPQVGIDTEADVDVKENVKSISAKIAPFLRAMKPSQAPQRYRLPHIHAPKARFQARCFCREEHRADKA